MLQSADPQFDRVKRIAAENSDVPLMAPHPDLGARLLALGIDEIRLICLNERASTLMMSKQGDEKPDLYTIPFTTALCTVLAKKIEGDRGRKLPTFDRPFSGAIEIETNNRDRVMGIGQRLHDDGVTLRVRPDRMYRSRYDIPVVPFSVIDDPIEVA